MELPCVCCARDWRSRSSARAVLAGWQVDENPLFPIFWDASQSVWSLSQTNTKKKPSTILPRWRSSARSALAGSWQVDEEPLLPSYRTSQFATSRAEWGRAGGASQPPRVRESTWSWIRWPDRDHGPRRVHEGPRPRPAGWRGEDVAEEEDSLERDQEHLPPTAPHSQQVGTLQIAAGTDNLRFDNCQPAIKLQSLEDAQALFYYTFEEPHVRGITKHKWLEWLKYKDLTNRQTDWIGSKEVYPSRKLLGQC